MSENDVRTLINGIEDDVLRDVLNFSIESNFTSYYQLKIYACNNNMHTWVNALNQNLTRHHVCTILNMMTKAKKQKVNVDVFEIKDMATLAEKEYEKRFAETK